jgi:Na+/H+-dicarboxylate symporter
MTGVGANVAVLGLILPIYTVIDMVETAVNVWSDSCVCAMTNHDLSEE